jgi:hypothetical protein
LRPGEDADFDVALRAKAFGENAQRHRLAGSGRSGHQGEAALANQLLGPPAEGLDAARHVQRLDRHIGREWVPLQAIERQQLLGHDVSPSSVVASSLGR